MVTRRTMMISRFVHNIRPAAQQQPPQGCGQTPPPPPLAPSRQQKRQRTTSQTPIVPSDEPTRIHPQPSSGIVICEPMVQTGMHMASSSRAAPEWRPTFQLDGKPLPSDAYVHVWEKGKGGRVAHVRISALKSYCMILCMT